MRYGQRRKVTKKRRRKSSQENKEESGKWSLEVESRLWSQEGGVWKFGV